MTPPISLILLPNPPSPLNSSCLYLFPFSSFVIPYPSTGSPSFSLLSFHSPSLLAPIPHSTRPTLIFLSFPYPSNLSLSSIHINYHRHFLLFTLPLLPSSSSLSPFLSSPSSSSTPSTHFLYPFTLPLLTLPPFLLSLSSPHPFLHFPFPSFPTLLLPTLHPLLP